MRLPVDIQHLGTVGVEVPAEGAPLVRAEIGHPARGQLLLWRETSTGSLVHLLARRVGKMKPPIEEIEIGSGHGSDGSSPGAVMTTSPTVPFELKSARAGLPAGRYAVELQLRSTGR